MEKYRLIYRKFKRKILKTIINIILKITWFNNLGFRLRYRIKGRDYNSKRVGWTISIFNSSIHPIKKKWKKITTLGWFNSIEYRENNNISGFADPFLISYCSEVYVFFELIINSKGEIWYAILSDNGITPARSILQETFHISYPNIFYKDESVFMIPETGKDYSVRLYIAEEFPNNWSLKKILIEGKHFVDTSFIKINGIYYWFVFDFDLKSAMLFYSEGLEDDWLLHPQQENINYRNGGQIFQYNGSIYRPVQMDGKTYGSGLMLMKINDISKLTYDEEIYSSNFLVKQNGYSLEGSHHLSFIEINGNWIAATDGINRNYYRVIIEGE